MSPALVGRPQAWPVRSRMAGRWPALSRGRQFIYLKVNANLRLS